MRRVQTSIMRLSYYIRSTAFGS